MSRPSKPKLTKAERVHRECMLYNSAGHLLYRYERYNEACDQKLSKSVKDRRHREFIRACEALSEVASSRLPDAFLQYVHGDAAVAERDKLLGAGADVVPFKRSGRPIGW